MLSVTAATSVQFVCLQLCVIRESFCPIWTDVQVPLLFPRRKHTKRRSGLELQDG